MFVGHSRLQYRVRRVERCHGTGAAGLQCRVPTVEQPGNLPVGLLLRLLGDGAVYERHCFHGLDKWRGQQEKSGDGTGFHFHRCGPLGFNGPTLPIHPALAIGQPVLIAYAIRQIG